MIYKHDSGKEIEAKTFLDKPTAGKCTQNACKGTGRILCTTEKLPIYRKDQYEWEETRLLSKHLRNFIFGQTHDFSFGSTPPERQGDNRPMPFPVRFLRIIQMLLHRDADLIYLQENDYPRAFQQIMGKFDYGFQHVAKVDNNPASMYNGKVGDGCSILYKTRNHSGDFLQLAGDKPLTELDIEVPTSKEKNKSYKKYGKQMQNGKRNTRFDEYERKQVAFSLKLKVAGTKKELVAVTGHFKSGSKEKDYPKKNVGTMALAKVFQENKHIPVIFAGDLNTHYDTPCGSYNLLFTEGPQEGGKSSIIDGYRTFLPGGYPKSHEDFFTTIKQRIGGDQDKLDTTMGKHIEDYFFSGLKPLAMLTIPHYNTYKELNTRGLPNTRGPSDHFAIGAIYSLYTLHERIVADLRNMKQNEAADAFEVMDTNKDGNVDKGEFIAFAVKNDVTKIEAEEMFRVADANKNGELDSVEEFLVAFKPLSEIHKKEQETQHALGTMQPSAPVPQMSNLPKGAAAGAAASTGIAKKSKHTGYQEEVLFPPKGIQEVFGKMNRRSVEGSRVTCAETKFNGKKDIVLVAKGEKGIVVKIQDKRYNVQWGRGFIGWGNFKISAYALPKRRRRMAQREFSNRRDSPVMVRLLQEIIDAQDD